ncbi:MAG TPA: putative Ig domain-containing protein [Nitrospira sp.]|nr:putative Ig domain-containing protein [Nitrospira sp.]
MAIITTSLPEGQVNQPYSASVGGSGGALPYLWSVTPALPAGLSLNTQSGAITGTPGTVGTSSHTFTLVDSSIPPQTIETSLSLTIKPPLSITTTSLPAGNIGAVYSQPVQTVGGFGPLTFNIVVPGTGTLPPGFNLNPSTGVISGTATATGTFPFTVRVADTSGQQDTQAFSIRIDPQSPPQITTTSLPGGTVSLPYNQTVQAAAGIGTLTWSITVGSLPPGLTIGPSLTGPSVTISGTPTSQGTFNFTVRVTDTLGQVATRALSITINLPAPPNITITTLPAGTIGQNYNQAVLATGTGPLTFNIVSPGTGTLPPGLNLNTSTGTITGAPTATGNFPFTVRVADTFGQSDTQALSILVSTDNPPQIVPPSLPSGTVGVAYGPTTLQATGGNGTLTWSISAGSLPPGLTGPPSTGPSVTISGTPTSQGTFNFTVRVTDSLGQSDTRALSITINLPPPLDITTTSLPGGSIGQTYSQTVAATGGTGARTWSVSAGTLPLGLNLDATTGVISGTPNLPAGTSNFTVRVADAAGQSDTQDLSITINLLNPPQITPTTLSGGTVGQPYNQTLQATGGVGALTWSVSAGSPPNGLSLSPSGVISGTPTTAETANFTVRVADTLSQTDTQDLSIVVSAALTITTTSLPNAKEGEAYTTTLQSSGGLPPISWSVNPPLPDALSLNPATGEISGTPGSGTTGTPPPFTFTVQDSSPTPQTANMQLELTIDPP